jgi:ATP-dependent DNA helicase RecQ
LNEQFALFEKVYPQKTLSEWNSFINEIKIEDTYIPKKNSILITTMHKSKGKEFDNVYIMLRNYNAETDAQKRVLYMAITRAKNTLSIHTNSRQFNNYSDISNFTYSYNETVYEEPHEILIQLGHRDVYLSGFKYKRAQEIIKSLISGDSLLPGTKKNTLYTKDGLEVLSFSKSFSAMLDKKWYSKGYSIKGSKAQFILLWKDALDETECRIVLPNLRLERE